MAIISSILRIGNSCGIIIPSKMMKSLSLSEKDEVLITESGSRLILQKVEAGVQTPFSALDRWCEENGFGSDDSLESSLEYVDSIRGERKDKDIPQW